MPRKRKTAETQAPGSGLQASHKAFAEEWARSFDGREALAVAGLLPETEADAVALATKLLKRQDVWNYIQYLLTNEQQQPGNNLDPRHKVFADEWTIHFNGPKAIAAAGFNPKSNDSARALASKLLKRKDVWDYIQHVLRENADEKQIRLEAVIEEMRRVGFSDIRNVMRIDERGRPILRNLDELPREVTAAISEISYKETLHGSEFSVKMHPKIDALKHFVKYFNVDANFNELVNRLRAYGYTPVRDPKLAGEATHHLNEAPIEVETTVLVDEGTTDE